MSPSLPRNKDDVVLHLTKEQSQLISEETGVTLRTLSLPPAGFVALGLAARRSTGGGALPWNRPVTIALTPDQTGHLRKSTGRDLVALAIDVDRLSPSYRAPWRHSTGSVDLTDQTTVMFGGASLPATTGQFFVRLPQEVADLEAFGDGSHPTTLLAVQLMERLPRPLGTVADIGSGSGILTALAAKLGARHIDAFETEDIAERATRLTADANGVAPIVSVKGRTIAADDGPYDVIVANLLAATIVDLSRLLAQALSPDGTLIVSGVIRRRMPDVVAALGFAELRKDTEMHAGDWSAGAFHRQ